MEGERNGRSAESGRLLPADFYYYVPAEDRCCPFYWPPPFCLLNYPSSPLAEAKQKDRTTPKTRNIVTGAARLAAVIRSGPETFSITPLGNFSRSYRGYRRPALSRGIFFPFALSLFLSNGGRRRNRRRKGARGSRGSLKFIYTGRVSLFPPPFTGGD